MSRLDELILELCHEGVLYVTLGTIAEYVKERIDATEIDADTYVGVENLLPEKMGKTVSSYVPNEGRLIHFHAGDILIGNIRPYLKKIWLADSAGGTNGDVLPIHIKDGSVEPKYLYYCLSSDQFFLYDMQHAKGAKMPRGDKAAVMEYKVPVPPLEVQREIVRVLDDFTFLTAELITELSARKKQYEYYRDSLLSFSKLIPIKKIGEITRVFSAARVHKDQWKEEGVPFFRSSDVIAAFNGEPNSRGKAYISQSLYEELSKRSGRFEKDDILVTGGGTIGIPYIVPSDAPLYVKDADLLCIKRNDLVKSRFLYHYFLSTRFREYLRNITGSITKLVGFRIPDIASPAHV